MRLITLEEQIAVVEKVHKANVWLATAYPGTQRVVTLKTDRAGMVVYIHGETLGVENYLPVEPWEWNTTVGQQLAEVHSKLDAIIEECNSVRVDKFVGAA